jgi:hypothetical protein
VNRALVFRRLAVRRMPGFPGGGPTLSELSPGINLIHGPNASGKTTAAMALQSLLWPAASPEGAGLGGLFELGGEGWRVDVESRRPSWQREGQDSPPPPLPPAGDRDRYFLSLHGLLLADDRDLAERIRVESAGGYDVRAAAAELGYGAGGRPKNLVDALTDARGTLETARAAEAALRDEAAELERLRVDHARLEKAAGRIEPLRRALALARAADRLADAERGMAAFPAALERLKGDELERIAEWDRDRETCARKIATAEADTARATAELDAAGLGEEGVPGRLLAELESRLDGLRRLDDERARARADVGAARGRRERAGVALGIDPAHEPLIDPSALDVDRLDRLVRRAGTVRERRAALEERIRVLEAGHRGDTGGGHGGGDAGVEAADRAGQAVRVLRGWLRAATGEGDGERRTRTLLLIAIVVIGAAGLAAAFVGSALLASPGLIVGGFVLVALAILLLVLRPGREADGRGALERQANRLGHAPTRWTADAVETLLDELEGRAAADRVAGERRLEVGRLRLELGELAVEEAAVEAERTAIAADLWLAPAPQDLSLHVLATRLREWEHARGEEAAADGLLREVETRLAVALAGAAQALGPFGYEPTDADAVAGALKELRDRRDRHTAAAAALDVAREAASRGAGEREELDARRAALFGALGLTADREPELHAWMDQLDAFRDARADLEAARRDHVTAAEALAALANAPAPDLRSAAGRATAIAELERAVLDAEQAGIRERECATRMARLQTRLEAARQKHDVEEALARVAEAEAELADRLERDVGAEIGAALVEWLDERDRDRNRPAVFHRARDLFGLITRGRYRLDMDEGDGVAFRAYDRTTHRGHALDELSSGTRLQLLLAVRMAFVESQETGAALPLLLDEVLANCDDDRAAAIIDAALALARAGRQIFYFTAQADELVKWRSRLEAQDALEEGRVDWCVRGIVAGSGSDPATATIQWPARPLRPEVPTPAGRDHAGYGRALRVPPFDPRADGVGGVHLWYLVDDVDALHQLLAMGVSRWGQLEYLADAASEAALPGGMREAVVDQARRAAALCERFRQLWRQGRGRPVDRATLAESGAISDTFMEPVAALCIEVDGEGQALVDALHDRRVAGFRSSKADELRAFLHAGGFLTDGEQLSPEEIRVRLVADAGDTAPGDVDTLIERLTRGPAT